MTSTEATTATSITAEWNGVTIHLTSEGDAYVSTTGIPNTCDQGFTCSSCWEAFRPGWEFSRQGTREEVLGSQLSTLRYEVAELQRKIEQEYISIEKVQQVGHDYSVQQEWCSVYEEAFSKLTTPYYPDGIPTLELESDVLVTVTYRMTVRPERRQRVGDTDYMERSIDMWRVRQNAGDPFDSSFEVTSDITVQDVTVSLDD
jgi:hypothetical protein